MWVCGLLAGAGPAAADGFNGQRFVPAAGAVGGFMVEQPDVPRHLGFGAGLFLNYSLNAVVLRNRATDETEAAPLEHALSFNLLGSIGLFNFLEVALDIPIHALYMGDDTSVVTFDAGPGLGDIRLVNKVAWWLGGSPRLNFYVGAALPLTFPTGNEEELRGAGGVTMEPRALFGMGAARWRFVANLGFRSRLASMDVDLTGAYELTYGLAGTFGLLEGSMPLDLQGELVGGWHPDADHASAPLETLLGAIFWPHPEWSIYGAIGPGLTNGLGTPDFRFVAGVRFGRRVPGRDRYTDSDADGIPDYRDDCKNSPEDFDGFEDDDGCPEADNDKDGILDNDDECPVHAEEPGGDGDGCPDKGKVYIRRGKLVIFGKILFKTGSDEPLEKSHQLLDDIADTLKGNPDVGPLRIEGHTDNVGDDNFNLRLSQKRADSVKRALVDRGVKEEILSTRGFGERKPIAPNETPAGRARNRRVEFIVVRK
jgi:outer membrane protein OmpA-like peptidoglycan-associated protein